MISAMLKGFVSAPPMTWVVIAVVVGVVVYGKIVAKMRAS